MRIEEGTAEVPWCFSCGIIMVLRPIDAIKLAMQQFHDCKRLLHVHWCVFV
jgi:hypothetical protein